MPTESVIQAIDTFCPAKKRAVKISFSRVRPDKASEEWYCTKSTDISQDVLEDIIASLRARKIDEAPEQKFRRLAREWSADVASVSSLTVMVTHPAYRQIVEMGWAVVPFLLRDLEANKGYWFSALKQITSITPYDPRRDAGNVKRMTKAWVQWGKRKQLI